MAWWNFIKNLKEAPERERIDQEREKEEKIGLKKTKIVDNKTEQGKMAKQQKVLELIRDGNTALDSQDYDTAIEYFDKANKKEPKNKAILDLLEFALTSKGLILVNNRDYLKALKFFERGIKLNNNSTAPYVNKGLCYENLKNYKEALKNYEKALEINPKNSMALNNKGYVLCLTGKFEEAIKYFDTSLKINPQNTLALTNRQMAFEAIHKLQEQNKMNKIQKQIFEHTKDVLFTEKQLKELLEKNQKLLPTHMLYQDVKNSKEFQLRGYALHYSMIKEHGKAIEYATKGIKINPKSAYLFYIRGRSKGDKGLLKEGMDDLNKAIKLRPTFADAFVERGYIRQKSGDILGAKKDYKKAQDIEPSIVIPSH
jgi:tetratricopeptide (TPR) repeat protein